MKFREKDIAWLISHRKYDQRTKKDWRTFLASLAVMFILIIFLGLAGMILAAIWCVILAAWFIRRGRRWRKEDLETAAQAFQELPEEVKQYEH